MLSFFAREWNKLSLSLVHTISIYLVVCLPSSCWSELSRLNKYSFCVKFKTVELTN